MSYTDPRIATVAAIAATFLYCSTFGMVQASETNDVVVSVGLGAAYVPDYEGSDDYRFVPLPYLRFANIGGMHTYVDFSGRRIRSNFIDHPHWRFGVTAGYESDYQGDSYLEEIDDERVSLLQDTASSLQTGVVLGYDFSTLPHRQYLLEMDITRDVLHGRGNVITPRFRISQPFLSPRLMLSAALSATWANDEYMQNRFGISAADSLRSGLDEHIAESSISKVAAEASLTWLLDRQWAVVAFSHYQRLDGDAADSPIVEDRGDADNYAYGAMVVRRF